MKCRKCGKDMTHEVHNFRSSCYECQLKANRARYKRIYQKRKARAERTEIP